MAALGCCKHSGPDLWLMTESCTGRILPSAAPGTFIAAPVLTPSVISPATTLIPFYFPSCIDMRVISSFVVLPVAAWTLLVRM